MLQNSFGDLDDVLVFEDLSQFDKWTPERFLALFTCAALLLIYWGAQSIQRETFLLTTYWSESNHQQSTINHQPSTINPQPCNLHPEPCTPNTKPSTPYPTSVGGKWVGRRADLRALGDLSLRIKHRDNSRLGGEVVRSSEEEMRARDYVMIKAILKQRMASRSGAPPREFSIDNLLVRIHLIIEMVLVDRACAIGV